MFFHFTPTQESPQTAEAEQVPTPPTPETGPQPTFKLLRSVDGHVVLDGEGLTRVVSVSAEPPDAETLSLTRKWVGSGWVPLSRLPEWQTPAPK